MQGPRHGSIALALSVLGVCCCATRGLAAPVVFTATGPDAASIQAQVNAFRTLMGANNGVGGTFPGGRREINWDGVPAAFENPHPGNFFNSNSPRGVEFTTPGSGFRVSGAAAAPTFEFGDLGANYPAEFTSFSAPKLFSPVGGNVTDINFFLPGTGTPADTVGFGAVFTGVDLEGVTEIEFFRRERNPLFNVFVPASPGGLSFVGVFFDAGERATHLRITTGTAAIDGGAPLIAGQPDFDYVVMDDFIYGEPRRIPEPATLLLAAAAGWTLQSGNRRRC